MARVLFGPIVTGARGSVGGTTFSAIGARGIIKRKAISKRPETQAQQLGKQAMARFSPAWRGLTQAQRDDWATYADTVTLVDSLGQDYSPQPLQAYLRNQLPFAPEDADRDDDAPTATGLPTVPTVVFDVSADDLRVFSIAPVLPTDAILFVSVLPATLRTRKLESGRVVVRAKIISTDTIPIILVADYGAALAAGTEARWNVRYRYVDADQRISINFNQTGAFTA